MKKENMIIVIAFFICVGVIALTFNLQNTNKEENKQQTSSQYSTAKEETKSLYAEISRLKQENETLKKVLLQQNATRNTTDILTANVFDPQTIQDNYLSNITPADYQKYYPFIKELIEYAKTHKIPTDNFKEIVEISRKAGTPIVLIGYPKGSNMNYIEIDGNYYIKLLQNMVAIYSKGHMYHIDFDLQGNATCVGKDEPSYELCQKLGGVNPEPNSRIPTWIAYRLPKNIFD
ncbi:MAG: hypothetical protein IKP23_03805 [Elusimicrobiaceae bacterium]|nr:hypothetical protein [Elusimicrobiaceae bacterium]